MRGLTKSKISLEASYYRNSVNTRASLKLLGKMAKSILSVSRVPVHYVGTEAVARFGHIDPHFLGGLGPN